MSDQIHLGRDTDATMRAWDQIGPIMPVAPKLFRGTRPKKTNNAKFLLPRYAGQLIGCCVGEGNAHGIEYLTRLPADGNPNSDPRPGQPISALAIYLQARAYSRAQGMRLGSEGAIVSHAGLSISDADGGVVRYDYYPATPAAYRSYSDRVSLSAEALADKTSHVVKRQALLDSADAILDSLASGRAVVVGTMIPSGMTQPDASGQFSWSGRYVGGHCYLAVDYDEDANTITIDNSWDNARWGDQSGKFPRPVGTTSLSKWLEEFNSSKLSSGTSEALVYDDDGGWAPKLIYDNSW